MALIKCNNCGNMVSDKAEKCIKCGAPIEKGVAISNDEISKDTDSDGNTKVDNASSVEEYIEEPQRKRKGLMVLLCGFLFIVIAIGAYFFLKGADGESKKQINDEKTVSSTWIKRKYPEPAHYHNKTPEAELSSYAGLSFRTFTEKFYDGANKATFQAPLSSQKVANKLVGLGFKLIKKKTETRPDYTGEEYYNVTIETYSKTVNGHVTTVELDDGGTEIHFPNIKDVEEFKKTVQACGLKETKEGFKDNEDVYWAGTNVYIKGTVVTLSYKCEP